MSNKRWRVTAISQSVSSLEQVNPSTKPGRPPRWKQNPDLLAWLDSL
jgi:hypothetical protein